MRAGLWVLAPLVLLAGCGGDSSKTVQARAPVPTLLIPDAPTPADPHPQCDAKSLAWLVGKPREQIPVPVLPSRRRVTCVTCPMADDFRPERTNILFDPQTRLITSVTCG